MEKLRVKITIELNGNHALSIAELVRLKPLIERGVAASLPTALNVDTINVTKIKEALRGDV
jgi:hypothetical protein